jgi:hypothetical protein
MFIKHMGKHILLAFRRIPDPLSLKPGVEVGVDPCGWCGREDCQMQLVQGKSIFIQSSCLYHYAKMSYARAVQPTKTSPCTSVPVHCPICPESFSGQPKTIWKYNAMSHFESEHRPAHDKKLAKISP